MTEKNQRLLQIPQGTEIIYLEEAFRHQQAVSRINSLFTSWGYLPVETPLFDFFDIYQELLAEKVKDVYRLIDREGDLLMLRSDITLFLAKQMGLLLNSIDLPKRVYYSGAILRHQNREDISKNEFFQTGIELIGKSGTNADMEVLVLLIDTFKLLNISPVIHIGSRDIINSVLSHYPKEFIQDIFTAVGSRNFSTLETLLRGNISAGKIPFIMDLFRFIGTNSEFKAMLKSQSYEPDKQEKESLNYLTALADKLEELGIGEYFRIDLSETGNQAYYTGIVFQGYIKGSDSAVVSGGRYDSLLRYFGFDAPSVGFSILLRKVEEHLGSGFSLPDHTKINSEDFITAYREAEKIRKEGGIAIL